MAPFKSDDSATTGEAGDVRGGRRRAARYVVPVTVVGVAAATIGLVPAFAGSGDPDLPEVSAQELIEKIAASDVDQLSGTVKISTDLGLPDLGGLASGLGAGGGAGGDDGSTADPSARLTELATGTHTLRVAVDGPDKQKLSLLDEAAEYSVIHNGDDVWAYDSGSNEVYHATGGADGKDDAAPGTVPGNVPATPKELAEEALRAVDDTTSVTVDGTAQVAGRDAYKLLVEPRQAGSTVGAVSVAVDAETGLPLKFTLTPASGGAAVVDAGFTKVDFAAPSAATFDFTPPEGAKVTEAEELDTPDAGTHDSGQLPEPGEEFAQGAEGLKGMKVIGEGWSSIAAFDTGDEGLPTASSGEGGGDLDGFLNSLGDEVSGPFGSGTVFSTRLVNVLITDDGKAYAGAVTKEALVKAANTDR
ncbi:sigma-E factor regulatory protein RseB domain-containing protein [Streptomyces sp. CRN 30]|uniref:LolA family protein n=1 Tax=Streptomyces sp. CRN 30 TaxID=3075613 RepID=UPI002A817488|nr:sigma-E factor regulatory protein RseB domain-containing protein [Streptomyces sp. CRN 30]